MDLDQVREELVRLFKSDDWEITRRAEKDGREILKRYMQFPTQVAIVDFVMDRLKAGYPFHEIRRGEPLGARVDGYVMNYSDEKVTDLYIELIIEDDRVWIISFHISKHAKEARV
jgi:hypothetical protein